MARKREFDPQQALDAAMGVFWEKGYTATSVEDLVAATGVNRYGLYDVYDSKRDLFLAALKRYSQTVIRNSTAELEQRDAGIDAIRSVFNRMLAAARAGRTKRGCLMCNIAEEVAPFDDNVGAQVAQFQRRLARLFRRAVVNAQKNGDIPIGKNPAQLGHYLGGLIQGVSYLARSQAGVRSMEDFVRVGLQALQ